MTTIEPLLYGLKKLLDKPVNITIRKIRAQTLWDAFAREMTPFATEALQIINPNSQIITNIHPIMFEYGVSSTSTSISHSDNQIWGYNQQIDYILRLLQDGLYCLNKSLIKNISLEIANQFTCKTTNTSAIYQTFIEKVFYNSPFIMSEEIYKKIDQLIPDQFAFDDPDNKEQDNKGDKKRLYKLCRIAFFLLFYRRHYIENPGENLESYQKWFQPEFINGINCVLEGQKKTSSYSPSTLEEKEVLFIAINKYFDHHIIEPNFQDALNQICPKVAKQIYFKKNRTGYDSKKLHTLKNLTSFYIEDNRHKDFLDRLQEELKDGAYSLVGGRDYARMRFPEAILKQMALGQVNALIFDGTKEEALEYIYSVIIPNATEVLEFQVCGQYGDFAKIFLKYLLPDNTTSQLFIVAQRGESRVLSNAAALLLYSAKKNERGKRLIIPSRISSKNIRCIYRVEALNSIIKEEAKDILEFIQDEIDTFGSEKIKTIIMPMTSADTIIQSLEQSGFVDNWINLKGETIGSTSIVTLKDQNQSKIRIIAQSVGGSGLYGNTAGIFIEELLKLANEFPDVMLSFDIRFFATAGAIASKEFHPMEGDLCSPTESFIGIDFNFSVSVPKLDLSISEDLKVIYMYKNHGWAACPAIETSELFLLQDKNKNSIISMIDVEGLEIAKAVNNFNCKNTSNNLATFTPVYFTSDLIKNRKDQLRDPFKPDFDSYAFGSRVGMAIRLSPDKIKALKAYLFL